MAGFRWFQVVSGWFLLVLDGFRLLLILVSTINKKLVLCLVDFGSQGNGEGRVNESAKKGKFVTKIFFKITLYIESKEVRRRYN